LEQVAAAADSCAIVGTCRDGPELEIARGGHDGASVQGLHISEVYKRFYTHRYVIHRLTDEEIDRIAEGAGKDPSSVDRSDCATPGDILLQQNKQDMRARFEDRLSRGEQHVLHAGQLLDAGQVEPTRERIQWVVASLYDRPRSVATGGALQDTLRQLEEMRFLSSTSPIVLEPAYTRLDVGPGRIVAPYAPGRQVGEDLVALISLLSKRNDAEGLVGLGIGLREREKTEKALECLNRAVDIDRSNARAWFYRGFLLHDLGRPSEEIFDSFDRAVEADPSCAVAWFNRGTVLDRLGRPDEALESFDRAVEADPSFAKAWSNRGIVLKELGRPDEALDSYDQAVEADPSFAKAWHNRGIVLSDLGRSDEALDSFDRAVEADPSFVEAWYGRGVVLKELGRPDEALDSYDRAVEADPSHAKAWYRRGVVLKELGRPDEALDSYDQAVEADPSDAKAWHNRGIVLYDLGRLDEARTSYDRACELDPDLCN
jgi:tetratricopeptide (TPR) repeat protein